MESIAYLLRKNRKINHDLIDNYFSYKVNNKKIENYSTLFLIDEDKSSKAYFDPRIHVIVIINDDGFIDNIFYLYDKKMKIMDSKDIGDKLKVLLNSYYNSTKSDFIVNLYELGFISYSLYKKLCRECLK